MIERHVTFNVLVGKEAAFEKLFKEEYSVAMSKLPGFVRVRLIREQEKPTRYQMVICFQTVELAAAWRASAAHEELRPKIGALNQGTEVLVYDVIVD